MRRQGETTIASADLDELAQTLMRAVAEAAKVYCLDEDTQALGILHEAVRALRDVEKMGGEAVR